MFTLRFFIASLVCMEIPYLYSESVSKLSMSQRFLLLPSIELTEKIDCNVARESHGKFEYARRHYFRNKFFLIVFYYNL